MDEETDQLDLTKLINSAIVEETNLSPQEKESAAAAMKSCLMENRSESSPLYIIRPGKKEGSIKLSH